MRLVARSLSQLLFQFGHIDNPRQRAVPAAIGGVLGQALGTEVEFAAVIAPYLHFTHRRGKGSLGPCAQGFKKLARGAVQGVSPDIDTDVFRRQAVHRFRHKGDPQALSRQQQGKCVTDYTVATNTNIKRPGHASF